ncbi:MAG: type IV pilin protein [Dyella sp.]
MKIDSGSGGPANGFTLIELMVVVAIVAILAAIAIPSYSRYVYRARRVDGQQLLLKIATAQERYYALNNKYAVLSAAGFSSDTVTSEKGYYTAQIATASLTSTTVNSITVAAQGYTATATPIGAQAADQCTGLSIDNTGAKTFTSNTPVTNGTCW